MLTNRADDEQDEEGVEHGRQRCRERRHDVAEGAHAAEEAHDAEGAEGAEHVDGHGHGPERDEREGDDDEVESVPAVAEEGADPVGVEVDGKFDREDCGEKSVHQLQTVADYGRGAAARVEGAGELRFRGVNQKVLPQGSSDIKNRKPGLDCFAPS